MIRNEYTLTVDIKKSYKVIIPAFVQYDTAKLIFKVFDDGKPFDFSSYTEINLFHRRPDKSVIIGEATVETVNGQDVIVYNYLGSEMDNLGYVETSVSIRSEERKVSIHPFKVLIIDNIGDDAATPANPEFGKLQELIARAESVIKRANDAADEAIIVKDETETVKRETELVRDSTEAERLATEQVRKDTEDALERAEQLIIETTDVKDATEAVREATELVRVATEKAKDDAIIATENANNAADYANEQAGRVEEGLRELKELSDELEVTIDILDEVIENAIDATNKATASSALADAAATLAESKALLAENAANSANDAASEALAAKNAVEAVLPNIENMENLGEYDNTYHYKKNNIVEYNGSSFQALQDSLNHHPPLLPIKQNAYWSLLAQRGVDGTGSVSSVNNIHPDASGNVDLGTLATDWDSIDGKPEVLLDIKDDNGKLTYKGDPVGSVTSVNGQIGDVIVEDEIIQQDTPPDGIEEGRLWIDTSDNTFQGTVFQSLDNKINNHIDDDPIHVSNEDRKRWDDSEQNAKDYADLKISEIPDTIIPDAKDIAIDDSGGIFAGNNVEDALNETKTELDTHVVDYISHTGFAVATGIANEYIATLNPPLSTYQDGVSIRLKINIENTGASTIDVNGLGAVEIKKSDGSDLDEGQLKNGIIYDFYYNDTNFQLRSGGSDLPSDVDIDNFITSINSILGG